MRRNSKARELDRKEMRSVIGGGLGSSPLGFKPGKTLPKVGEVQPADVCPRLIGD